MAAYSMDLRLRVLRDADAGLPSAMNLPRSTPSVARGSIG